MNPLLMPFWEGNYVLDESALPLADREGNCAQIALIYHATEILSVRSATPELTFQAGKDYLLEDGKLTIPTGSRIPIMPYDEYYPIDSDNGKNFLHSDGGFIRIGDKSYFHERQIAVSYRHEDEWKGSVPEEKKHLLPYTLKRMEAGEETDILLFGDSISTGCNSSGWANVPPFQKPWYEMAVEQLAEAYHTQGIHLKNTSVGGKTSNWGCDTAVENAAHQRPDLCILAFGMNDGSGRVPVKTYIANIRTIMEAVRAEKPLCEFVLVATTLANGEVKGFLGNQADYLPALMAMETEGVCVADMTTVHRDLLARKAFRDLTGNNVNHPNDFLSRAYAQVLLRTLGVL